MDAAGEFLFSTTDINSLDGELPVAGHAKIGPRGTAVASGYGGFVNAFDEVQVLIPVRGRMGPYVWPLLEMKGDKAKAYRSVIDAWVQVSLLGFELEHQYLVGLCSRYLILRLREGRTGCLMVEMPKARLETLSWTTWFRAQTVSCD
jgi:hypothetical protein